LALCAAAVISCSRTAGQSESSAASGSTPSPTAPPTPADHLAPGELLEGTASAFGLRLPRGVAVEGAFPDAVVAKGDVSLHSFVRYLRARLVGGELHEGDMSATFDAVRVAAKPGPPLRIHLDVGLGGVRADFRDETPPAFPPLKDDDARWRRVGLTPNGHLADPQHIE
jgi:hypothetical protein